MSLDSAAFKDVLVVNPPLDSKNMALFLQQQGKSLEQFQREIMDRLRSFQADHQHHIACILVREQENILHIVAGVQEEHDPSIFDVFTDLELEMVHDGWDVNTLEIPSTDPAALVDFSDFAAGEDQEGAPVHNDGEIDSYQQNADAELDTLYALQQDLEQR